MVSQGGLNRGKTKAQRTTTVDGGDDKKKTRYSYVHQAHKNAHAKSEPGKRATKHLDAQTTPTLGGEPASQLWNENGVDLYASGNKGMQQSKTRYDGLYSIQP